DERDDRRAALDRPRLARDRAAELLRLAAHLLASGRDVGHADRDVAVAAAQLVPVDAVVVGELDLGVLGIGAVAEERKVVLLFGSIGGAQQPHAEHLRIEVDRALEVADPQHGVEDSHRASKIRQVVVAWANSVPSGPTSLPSAVATLLPAWITSPTARTSGTRSVSALTKLTFSSSVV